MATYRIEMNNINKSFGGVRALKGVTFKVKPGEIMALVGENGAGKSTLMNILSGLIRPDDGEIIIDGKKCEFLSAKDASKAGIGMVHQEFMLYPELSVIENIIEQYLQVPLDIEVSDIQSVSEHYREEFNKNGICIYKRMK